MTLRTLLIEPLDVLMLRGNKSFGDSGEHGASSMPPGPSVLSGALRSFWLAEQTVDTRQFRHAAPDNLKEPLRTQLGTPAQPGTFRLTETGLARDTGKGLERLYPLPADLVLQKKTKATDNDKPAVYRLTSIRLPDSLLTGDTAHPMMAVLKAPPGKPESGWWLSEEGFRAYLKGETPKAEHLVKTADLWKSDWRLGIGLAPDSRTAEDGQLYTTEAVALKNDIRLIAAISGAADFPDKGTLRLGGDGRGAAFHTVTVNDLPAPTLKNGRIKLLLTGPAILPQGSGLPGEANGVIRFPGGSARVAATSIPRHQVVSGWDLANWQPKPAERVVPAGAVYWLEDIQFSGASLQTALQDWLLCDLDAQRRAEGYNACRLAAWLD